ncbi:MAG: hypothetical protein CL877_08030 [Dehalococcoidales bacterium]|nr:hypothetical protein [Dehalococcoidales bacterium]
MIGNLQVKTEMTAEKQWRELLLPKGKKPTYLHTAKTQIPVNGRSQKAVVRKGHGSQADG